MTIYSDPSLGQDWSADVPTSDDSHDSDDGTASVGDSDDSGDSDGGGTWDDWEAGDTGTEETSSFTDSDSGLTDSGGDDRDEDVTDLSTLL